jgi:hypothetical protein
MRLLIAAAAVAALGVEASPAPELAGTATAGVSVVAVERGGSLWVGKREFPSPGKEVVRLTIKVAGGVKPRVKALKAEADQSALTDTHGRSSRPVSFSWSGETISLHFETVRNAELASFSLGAETFDMTSHAGSKPRREVAVEGIALGLPWKRPLEGSRLVLRQAGRTDATATAGANGRFRFEGVWPGHYVIALADREATAARLENGDVATVRIDPAGEDAMSIGSVLLPDLDALAYYRGLCEGRSGRQQAAGVTGGPEGADSGLVVLSRQPGLERLVRGLGNWDFDVELRSKLVNGLPLGGETLVCVTMLEQSVGVYQGTSAFDRRGAVMMTWTVRVGRPGSNVWQETVIRKAPPPMLERSAAQPSPVEDLKTWLASALAAH